jgi:hypothetical protein
VYVLGLRYEAQFPNVDYSGGLQFHAAWRLETVANPVPSPLAINT